MNDIVSGLLQFMLYTVIAFAAENALLGRALGMTRVIQMAASGYKGIVSFCAALTLVQVLSAPLCWGAAKLLANVAFRTALRPLVIVCCTCVALLAVRAAAHFLPNTQGKAAFVELLPSATFNTCVLGTLLVCLLQGFSLAQYLGFALGSGTGYLLALLLISEGQRRMEREEVPAAFRGMPVTMIYIGILAMVVYGFTGHTLAF